MMRTVLFLSQFSKTVPIKTASLRYAVCGCCLCIKNANCYNKLGQSLLNGSFVLHIQAGGGLVQQDDGRILQEGAGDGDALTLAAGKSAAVLADVGVSLVRQLLGKFIAVCHLCRQNLLGW